VLEGVAVQGGTSAFGPIVEALRSYLRAAGEEPLTDGPLAAHLALLLPELGPPAPTSDRATLFEAIRQALVDIARRRPTVLLLDDLQWVDDATPELLGALARSVDSEPLVLLGVFRSDELPRGHAIRRLRSELRRAGRLRQITLEPLGAESSAALLELTLGMVATASVTLCCCGRLACPTRLAMPSAPPPWPARRSILSWLWRLPDCRSGPTS